MPLANEYLGYDYFLSGTVFKGKQLEEPLGSHRKLKKIKDYKLIPPMVFMW
jgi:riboflavin kinase/FMN adenylyltransferase